MPVTGFIAAWEDAHMMTTWNRLVRNAMVGALSAALMVACAGQETTTTPEDVEADETTPEAATGDPTNAMTENEPDSDETALVPLSFTAAQVSSALPSLLALERGLFEEHGLDAERIEIGSGPDLGLALIRGDANVGRDSPANFFSLVTREGMDLVVFGQDRGSNNFDILVRSDYPLPNADRGWEGVMEDLQDATIGVVARGAAAEDLARGLFIEAGLDPDSPAYVATGLAATTVAALETGEIDAAISFEPALAIAVSEGIAERPFSIQRDDDIPAALNWPGIVYVASRDYAEQNPEALQGFLAATEEATEWITDPTNRDELIEFLDQTLGVNPEIADMLLEFEIPAWEGGGALDVERLQGVADFFHEVGRLDDPVDVADVYFDVNQ